MLLPARNVRKAGLEQKTAEKHLAVFPSWDISHFSFSTEKGKYVHFPANSACVVSILVSGNGMLLYEGFSNYEQNSS